MNMQNSHDLNKQKKKQYSVFKATGESFLWL